MHPFLQHLEEHLGQIQAGAVLRRSEDNRVAISAVRFESCPLPGATTFMTLGLSHHVSHQEDGPDVRIEFLIACGDELVERFNPASILADVSKLWMQTHHAPARGTVIGPKGRFFKESAMEALYCAAPVYFHDAAEPDLLDLHRPPLASG